MIPPLEDGVLPDGVHDAAVDEVAAAFGRFQHSDRRIRLTDRLRAHLDDARRAGIVAAAVVDGSYVTAKDEPDDIDVVVVLKPGVDTQKLRPFEYNTVSKRMIRKLYKLDAFPHVDGSEEYRELLKFFQTVNPTKNPDLTSRTTKGVVRIRL